ncbi:DUF2029 domain-containing protein [Nakamurella sp. DB0629]|uniref:DUF2029 domain-containing protein n=1 Tax=Nakamurella aerolata TaxID=1656892 RepID=A0A849ACF2_9ACTN|nr:DUF2029 domain-containing protein [Nakamurella aerolata]
MDPTERVIPTWTDPSARRASALIGGPLGRHAQVGRNKILTPLRVCLLMTIGMLIFGWLAKSACIQQDAKSGVAQLDQSGQRPWLTGCYNDVVPLYGSRGFDRPKDFPYANSFIELKSGGERRIYPAGSVHEQDGNLVANTSKGTVTLSDQDIVGSAEDGYQQVVGGQLQPVSDIADLGQVRYLEYPAVTGLFQWGISWVTEGYLNVAKSSSILPVPLDVAAYFTLGAIFLGLFYLWAVACTAKINRRRVWDTAIMCLSPLLVVHAFTNWDLLAIGLCAGGMWAWATRRPVLAGVLLGLGMAAKLYPGLLLGPLFILCLRAGKLGAFAKTLVAAGLAWLATNLPLLLWYPEAWNEFFRLNSTRPPEYDSWYFLFATFTDPNMWAPEPGSDTPSTVNNLSLVLFLLCCAAIGYFGLSVQRRPRFAQLAFLVVVAFLLTNKVWSPQYSLWLVPLVVLALPRWRPVIIWQLIEAGVWLLLMFQFAYVNDNKTGLPVQVFAVLAIVRGLMVAYLAVLVFRDMLRPQHDLVRLAGDDDPSGGVLDGAPDRFTLPSLPTLWRRVRRRRDDRPAAAGELAGVGSGTAGAGHRTAGGPPPASGPSPAEPSKADPSRTARHVRPGGATRPAASCAEALRSPTNAAKPAPSAHTPPPK